MAGTPPRLADLPFSGGSRRPLIFLSSALAGLRDARGAVASVLGRARVRVLAFERSDYPSPSALGPIEHCLSLVREADVVVSLVDSEYGSLAPTRYGNGVSITRLEVRVANEEAEKHAHKRIWCYARRSLLSEKENFDRWVQTSGLRFPTPEQRHGLFAAFSERGQAEASCVEVYDFMEEVGRLEVELTPFEDAGDLMEGVEYRLAQYIATDLHPALDLPAIEMPSQRTLDRLGDYALRSGRYRQHNRDALFNYHRLLRGWSPGALLDFRESVESISEGFFGDYIDMLGGTDMVRTPQSRLLITDTTMEYLNPDTWRSNKYHKALLRASSRLGTRFDLRFRHYKRVLLLRDPVIAIGDPEWRNSLGDLMKLHASHEMALGVCRRDLLPVQDDDVFLNFYLVRGVAAGLWGPEAAVAFHFTSQSEPKLIRYYTDIFDSIEEACLAQEGAFWIEPGVSVEEVAARIGEVFSTRL